MSAFVYYYSAAGEPHPSSLGAHWATVPPPVMVQEEGEKSTGKGEEGPSVSGWEAL